MHAGKSGAQILDLEEEERYFECGLGGAVKRRRGGNRGDAARIVWWKAFGKVVAEAARIKGEEKMSKHEEDWWLSQSKQFIVNYLLTRINLEEDRSNGFLEETKVLLTIAVILFGVRHGLLIGAFLLGLLIIIFIFEVAEQSYPLRPINWLGILFIILPVLLLFDIELFEPRRLLVRGYMLVVSPLVFLVLLIFLLSFLFTFLIIFLPLIISILLAIKPFRTS